MPPQKETSQTSEQILRMTASCSPGVTANFEALLDFREYLKEQFKIQYISLLSLGLMKYWGKKQCCSHQPCGFLELSPGCSISPAVEQDIFYIGLHWN